MRPLLHPCAIHLCTLQVLSNVNNRQGPGDFRKRGRIGGTIELPSAHFNIINCFDIPFVIWVRRMNKLPEILCSAGRPVHPHHAQAKPDDVEVGEPEDERCSNANKE